MKKENAKDVNGNKRNIKGNRPSENAIVPY